VADTRPSGRSEHETVEVPPELVCGHAYGPQLVTVGIGSQTVDGERVRTYRCNQCATVTYSP
jgi:hypothetical protein